MKKILSMFLVLCMIVTMLPVTATAEETEKTIPPDNKITKDGLIAPPSATTYDIWVGGVQVTSENKGAVTGTGITGTVTYDPDTSILTLNGATINGTYEGTWIDSDTTAYYGIYADTALKIELVGDSTITGKNLLNIASIGIYTGSTLNLSGSGSLYVSGGTGKYSTGIYSTGSITIASGDITATSTGEQTTSIAIASNNMITISNGTVVATANTIAANSYGIWATNYFTINDGTVTASGKVGFRGDSTIAISGGVVNATGSVHGIYSVLTVTGGTVTIKGGDLQALDGSLTTSGYAGCIVTADTNKDGNGAAAYNVANLATYKYIKVEPPVPLANTTPNIQIDFSSETLTGFVSGGQYTINGSSSFTIPDGEVLSIHSEWMGGNVSIVHKGNGATTSDSPAQLLSIPVRPAAPTNDDYTVEHETTAGANDGKLKLTISNCEFRPLNNYSGFWLDIPQNEWKENLPPDTYYVRKKAVENISFASENSTAIVINAGAPVPALVSDLSVGDVTLDSLTVGYVTSAYKSFVITNSGDAQATIRNVTTDNPSVFSIHPGQSFVDAGSSINSWQIRTETGLAAGTYSATITVTYDDDRTTTSAVSITINAPVNHDSTGRSSSSSNNSMPVIVTLPTAVNPDSPTQGEIKVPGTVDGNGNVTASITDKTVTDAFDKTLTEAKKNSIEQNGITVVLRVDTGNKTGSNITVNLPKTVQDTIIAKKIINTIVVVDNPGIGIGMDLETVKEINKQAKTDVNITAARTHGSKLTADAKKAIGSRPVFDLMVNYGNGNTIRGFGAGSVSITLPYTLAPNERAENVQAVYVDESGNVHWLKNSVYDNTEKVLRFTTNHFSAYGVGYKQSYSAFTDIAGHWAKEDIEFVTEHRIFNGTSDTIFSPDTDMTRGMFITVLGRFANADVSTYTNSSFIDVKDNAYYMSYIEWANKNNIAGGIGDYKFEPDQSVTREQMAFIINNYAKNLGYTLPGVHAENTFADNDEISSYAKEAVKQMQAAGIISGKNGNLFNPQGTVTRAEMSAVLHRFSIIHK